MKTSISPALTLIFFSFISADSIYAQPARAHTNFGFLSIVGSNRDDEIYVFERQQSAWYDSRTNTFYPAATYVVWWILEDDKWMDYGSIQKSRITSIAVLGNDGGDTIEIDSSLPTFLDGGAGSDFILGGSGPDEIHSGEGELDFLNGRTGEDVIVGTQKPYYYFGLPRVSFLVGGPGDDTYIYQNTDQLELDDEFQAGFTVTPSITFQRGRFRGLHQYSE